MLKALRGFFEEASHQTLPVDPSRSADAENRVSGGLSPAGSNRMRATRSICARVNTVA
jgi:hypothetical protein